MKLSDLSITNQQKQAVLESFLHQHYRLRIATMDLSKVRKVLEDVEQKKLNFIDSTPNYHTNKDYTKLALVSEALKIMLKELAPARPPKHLSESTLNEEQDLNQAELILAAKDIVANLQDLAEDIAKDQVDDLMPLVSRMKEVFGIEQAEGSMLLQDFEKEKEEKKKIVRRNIRHTRRCRRVRDFGDRLPES